MPPVSGGAATGEAVRKVALTEQPIDVEGARLLVGDPRCGATVVFTGTTREVPSLEYEAYEEMALQTMSRLADQVKASAPIWKREHPEEGPPRWVEGNLPAP